MKKTMSFVVLFFASVMISVTYQNCGESSIKANSSENDGLQVEVTPGDGTGESGSGDESGDGSSGGSSGAFSFNLANGDNIFYVDGGGLSQNLRTGKLLAQLYYTVLESQIYEPRSTIFPDDLSAQYCANSAFAHCRHLNASSCVGVGCAQPVRCHSQLRLSTADVNNTFQSINALQFLNRVVTPENPMISDCDNPKLYFNSDKNKLEVSLANPACVANGNYYASQGSDNIKSIFNTELNDLNTLGLECNNYSVYSWNTTKWIYKAYSGFTSALQNQFREVAYENAKVNIRWKDSGDLKIYCANQVFVNPPGVDVFFPATGLKYEMLRTVVAIADAPTAEIIYEDPVDGGEVREFYLNQISAQTFSGGAILNATQGQAMKDHIEVLVNRAKSMSLAVVCP